MKERFMSRIVSTIDTPGGHMLVCLFVILLGAIFAALKLPKSEDLVIAGSATLFQAMRGRGSENHITGPSPNEHEDTPRNIDTHAGNKESAPAV